tara:strand:- start:8483 stop:9370 length:888 start_codon:yes stop_codon:yes gene_type:complete
MKFTVEVKSGFCNVLKSLVTALSINENTNILPLKKTWWPEGASWDDLLDDELICHNSSELGESFISARFLILKTEESEQPNIKSDTNAWGCSSHPIPGHAGAHLGINIANAKLVPLFSNHKIDWSFDRSLICDKVFNRIQLGIQRVKWNNIITDEFNKVKSKLLNFGPLLTIQIRTWQSHQAGDRSDLLTYNDGVQRKYSFELYKTEIDKVLSKDKTIFLTIDREDLLPQYINYLKDYNVITYYKNETNLSSFQYSAVTMLLGSLSDFLVCSRLSTFAECMWWFGGCKAKVLPVG